MNNHKKLTYAQKSCQAKAGKLMYKTSMLQPGARIGVAVSGGEDSWVLLQILLLHQRKLPFSIDIMALHVNPGFDPDNHLILHQWLKKNGVACYSEVSDMGPRAHSSENRKNSPCFFCSWRRRKRIFQLAKKFRLSHVALGHNSEDLVQNFFLNLLYAGRVEGMYAQEYFFQGEFKLIRPLLWTEKAVIKKAAKDWHLPVWPNPCPSAGSSKRSEIGTWLEEVWKDNKKMRKNTFSALQRWQIEQNPIKSK